MPQRRLPLLDDPAGARSALVTRWLTLARVTLPAMAEDRRWPIAHDHCFMRVCLDTALGMPWHIIVRRPAIRHLTDDQLIAAIAVAESLARDPQTLHLLNQASLDMRRALPSTLRSSSSSRA